MTNLDPLERVNVAKRDSVRASMQAMRASPVKVIGGVWHGCLLRTARKAGRCDYSRGFKDDRPASENGRCPNRINVGDRYMEGEMNDEAGGFGHDRYCMQCAGPEARAALVEKK